MVVPPILSYCLASIMMTVVNKVYRIPGVKVVDVY